MALPAPVTHADLIVCDGCAAAYRRTALRHGEVARCRRCGALLDRAHRLTPEGQLAFALGALIVFVIANFQPIVVLNLRGARTEATLIEALSATWDAGQHLVSLLAAATAFVFPLAVIVLRLYVLAPLTSGELPPGFARAMHALQWVTRWSMVEVFMLGVLIAVGRSASLATAVPGAGLFAFAALAVLITANQSAGLQMLWERASALQAAAGEKPEGASA